MSISSASDSIQKIRGGDQQALGQLLNSLRPYVRLIVRSVLQEHKGRNVDESDLIQESLLQASRCSQTFHGQSHGEWLGWLRTITIRTAYRVLQTEKRHQPLREEFGVIVSDDGMTPCSQMERQENADRMALALTQLPEDMQQILMWRVIDDLDYQSIGRKMGRSPGAMRVLYLRALRRLREVWREKFASDSGVIL